MFDVDIDFVFVFFYISYWLLPKAKSIAGLCHLPRPTWAHFGCTTNKVRVGFVLVVVVVVMYVMFYCQHVEQRSSAASPALDSISWPGRGACAECRANLWLKWMGTWPEAGSEDIGLGRSSSTHASLELAATQLPVDLD